VAGRGPPVEWLAGAPYRRPGRPRPGGVAVALRRPVDLRVGACGARRRIVRRNRPAAGPRRPPPSAFGSGPGGGWRWRPGGLWKSHACA